MSDMFSNCYNLTNIKIDLNNSNVRYINYIFSNCYSLTSVELLNFNKSEIFSFYNVFDKCINLEYINLNNSFSKKNIIVNDNELFNDIVDNAVVCVEHLENLERLYNLILNSNCKSIDCSQDWEKSKKKYIKDSNLCVDSCNDTNGSFIYEYENTCLDGCPNGTSAYANSENILLFILN